MQYCLADVGILQSGSGQGKTPISDGTVFKYDGQSYFQLNESLDIKTLLKDVKCIPEYSLLPRTDASDSETTYLGLFLRRLQPEEVGNLGCIRNRMRMVQTFFHEVERHDFVRLEELRLQEKEGEDSEGTGNALSVGQFYERLREMHVRDVLDESIPEDVQHERLKPVLRPYQTQAIRWMLDRETVSKVLPAQYLRLRNVHIPGVDFYMYLDTFEVVDEMPGEIPIPPGGILADEMGMGKTVEILGLMLFNRKMAKKRKLQELENDDDDDDVSVDEDYEVQREIRCICSRNSKKHVITCQRCGLRQHRKCVLKNCVQKTRRYICPECWRSEPLMESGTTIIVSPVSIKMQWASEITKHIDDRSFKVFIYEGLSVSGWISPADLAQYDVVLTDYNVLKTEIYFTAENVRTSRHEKRFLRPVSPLPLVQWWRVCLDEAQMVEGVHNQTTKMVKTLPAVHRWTVTGTPIEKSMDNLYGLVHFLDYAPYNDYRIWCELTHLFRQCNPRPLLHIISRIMWRTCKAAVLDQLGIPPQTEVTHYITLSDLQNFFYRMEHTKCATAFREKAAKLADRATSMARMNIQTLNSLMEPMRKLRQDCTIPSILHRLDQTTKMLTPTELHDHLITKNEMDCKSQIRTIVSSLNGIAAIHVIRKEYDQAIKMYKSVLRWADDYHQGAICVDSLLQIHALHNLLEILQMGELEEMDELSPEVVAGYEKRCTDLEWKYIQTYSNLVKNVEQELNVATEKIKDICGQLNNKVDGGWWRCIIYEAGRDPVKISNFMLKLNIEINNHDRMARKMETVRGVDYTLTVWFDKIDRHREQLKKAFKSIDYFSTNLRPKHLWPADAKDRIEKLVHDAFLCHLDKELDDMPFNEREMRPTCVLCKVKSVLTQYECVIFDKEMIESGPSKDMTKGSWQMTVHELILRQIHAFSKRDDPDPEILAEGDLYISYLEGLKTEFKQYSKYWVEINYTAAAFDELNMCRSRLHVVTLEDLDYNIANKTIQQILDVEVDDTMQTVQLQKTAAEKEFVRLQGTLKYLHHLNTVQEIDVCPICQYPPNQKYAVLQCGHHFCIACASQILRMSHDGNIACVVCRHRQRVADIYYVTCNKLDPSKKITVRGKYSSKIIEIVETILQLKEQEPQVKIIVFSHWDPILLMLARALDENTITYRTKGNKFYKAIEEFKDYRNDVTCMLLPLKYGSKGLNLIEATHVFLVEPILNPGEELQAVGRVHRIGQTRPTFVHRFIVQDTIEETIHQTIQNDRSGLWASKQVTVEHLEQLFQLSSSAPALL